MKQYLNETLCESVFTEAEHNKPTGVLKRITGVVADFKPNRNGRVYPRELWEKVINSEYVKEMMGAKCLFGENNHPFDDRVEIDINNVSHAVNKLWIENDCVMGELDILPTKAGETINSLIEYGSKIGVSSRGAGSVLSDGSVDPNDYQFFTFDLVPRPSVAMARPTIVESEKVDVIENTLTESEIKGILNTYRGVSNIEEHKFNYITEGNVNKSISNNIIEKLLAENENLN